MVSPPWHNYRYHQNRLLSQENPKFNFWKIIWAHRHSNWRMDFSARTPVADHNISSYKTVCDIHLKHVFLTEFGLWQNPGSRLHQISFRFFGYHNLARTLVILNISQVLIDVNFCKYSEHIWNWTFFNHAKVLYIFIVIPFPLQFNIFPWFINLPLIRYIKFWNTLDNMLQYGNLTTKFVGHNFVWSYACFPK